MESVKKIYFYTKERSNFAAFFTTFSTKGSEISLEALLNAREERAILQQQLITQYGQTLLCITLTAVGGVKKMLCWIMFLEKL